MFWNRKKRKQEQERKAMEGVRAGDKPAPEPDISEPIKAFLAVSDEWEIDSRIENEEYIHVVTDPATGLTLEIVACGVFLSNHTFCLNHDWVTVDEAKAVRGECIRLKAERRLMRNQEERHEWKLKYQERS